MIYSHEIAKKAKEGGTLCIQKKGVKLFTAVIMYSLMIAHCTKQGKEVARVIVNTLDDT